MRLYLSSYHLGDHPDKLKNMMGDKLHMAVIINAVDFLDDDKRQNFLQAQFEFMDRAGLTAEEIDLRDYFDKPDSLNDDLNSFGGVWVSGGNVFILQRAYAQSGFGNVIKQKLAQDQLVYSGYSAGICIAALSLMGLDLCDDPKIVPKDYKQEFSWQGMGLVDYAIAPHYKSDHRESPMIDDVVARMKEKAIPFKTLRDGDVIVVDNGHDRILPRKET